MFRIDDPTAAAALPTPEAAGTEGYFTEGNPGASVPATLVRASWLNRIQEEIRAVVVAAAITPSKTVYTQLLTAIQTLIAAQALGNGQTWQDLTASRAFGTTYTNSTGRSIMVIASGQISTTTASTVVATIGAISNIFGSTASGVVSNSSSITVVIPPGVTYSMAMSGGTGTLFHWHELR